MRPQPEVVYQLPTDPPPDRIYLRLEELLQGSSIGPEDLQITGEGGIHTLENTEESTEAEMEQEVESGEETSVETTPIPEISEEGAEDQEEEGHQEAQEEQVQDQPQQEEHGVFLSIRTGEVLREDQRQIKREILMRGIKEVMKRTSQNDFVTISSQVNERVVQRLKVMMQNKEEILKSQKGMGEEVLTILETFSEVAKRCVPEFLQAASKPPEQWTLETISLCQKIMNQGILDLLVGAKPALDTFLVANIKEMRNLQEEMEFLEEAIEENKSLEVKMRITPTVLPIEATRIQDVHLRPGEKQIIVTKKFVRVEQAVIQEDGTMKLVLQKMSMHPIRTWRGWSLPLELYTVNLNMEEDLETDSEQELEEDSPDMVEI